MMRASYLKHRVTLLAKSVTLDPSYGTEVVSWTSFASRIPAHVQDVLPSRSESTRNGTKIATRPSRVRIRYLAGVSSDMRLVVHGAAGDRTLQIMSGPAELGQREGWEMMAEEFSIMGGNV